MIVSPIRLLRNALSASKPSGLFTPDPACVTTPTPKTLWIELTSKCPFDCVFCTRKSRFGTGRNLDFDIYKRLIAELDSPDFIGLNYSGESIHYPHLQEAIELAVRTGAATELVTAFSSVSKPSLQRIAESGLDRLAISLHTMDPEQYRRIYQFGSLELLKRRVAEFLEMRAGLGARKPRLDFSFVAIDENLDQLLPVVEYTRSTGAVDISIHPIIGRHLVPHDFSRELDGSQLRSGFKESLRGAVDAVRNAYPGFTVNVLNPDLDPNPRLSHTPAYFSPPLPTGARIHGCDQSPFESVHILAGADVVVCEVHDEVSMGNLQERSLREIWHAEAYREFRRKYVEALEPKCRSCVWKLAYVPRRWRSSITVAEGMSPQLLRGWHAQEDGGIIWARQQALIALGNPRRHRRVRMKGILPHGFDGKTNSMTVVANRLPIGEVRNGSGRFMEFDAAFKLPEPWDHVYLELNTEHLHRPSLEGTSSDSRDLAVGLQQVEVCG